MCHWERAEFWKKSEEGEKGKDFKELNQMESKNEIKVKEQLVKCSSVAEFERFLRTLSGP